MLYVYPQCRDLYQITQKLKLFLAGQRFSSNQEAIAAVEGYFADL
jgi:hypothetical protein